MPKRPTAAAALARLMELSYPPATLSLPVSRALGHKLASAITAKNPMPQRPFAACDGLAVRADDVWPRRRGPEERSGPAVDEEPAASPLESQPEQHYSSEVHSSEGNGEPVAGETEPHDEETGHSIKTNGAVLPGDEIEVHGDPPGGAAQFETAQSQVDLPGDLAASLSGDSGPAETVERFALSAGGPAEQGGPAEGEAEADEPARNGAPADPAVPLPRDDEEDEDANAAQTDGSVRLILRPLQPGKRDDALAPGYAVAVPAGAELPRGADFLIPLELVAGEPESLEPVIPEGFVREAEPAKAPMERRRREPRGRSAEAAAVEEVEAPEVEEELPGMAPARDWDLISRYQQGTVEVPLYTSRPPQYIVPAASWARSREELLSERSLLRATDIAMLEILGFDEVEVHRKPVVGIASLGLPMPVAQRRSDSRPSQQMMVTGGGPPRRGEEETRMVRVCPLTTLALNLCKTAQVAGLPLGFAPNAFRPLARAVSRWLSQVDVLLLIGGPSHGPRCLAQDVIAAQGKLALAGMQLEPAGGLSAGLVDGRPVVAIPGGLADVAVGFSIFARPLIHKHNPPVGYSPEIPLALENGSQLRPDRDRAVAVRYGYSPQYGMQATRYSGQRGRDPWLDIARGQAFIVLEAGREYHDGEVVRGFPY